MHSFGFTSHHCESLLQSLTSCGNFGSGNYYFLSTDQDIPTSIGDCLGSSSNIVAYDVALHSMPLLGGKPFGSWLCVAYNGTAMSSESSKEDPTLMFKLGVLSLHEKQTFVILLQDLKRLEATVNEKEFPEEVSIKVTYRIRDTIQKMTCQCSLRESVELSKLDANEEHTIRSTNRCHLMTHVLRIQAASTLQSMLDPAAHNRLPEVEELHDTILETLSQVQQIEEEIALRDEGILSSLDRDIGELLETLNATSNGATAMKAKFLQYVSNFFFIYLTTARH
jgi:hypothetical protein